MGKNRFLLCQFLVQLLELFWVFKIVQLRKLLLVQRMAFPTVGREDPGWNPV